MAFKYKTFDVGNFITKNVGSSWTLPLQLSLATVSHIYESSARVSILCSVEARRASASVNREECFMKIWKVFL